jgi:hypothetical protein
MTGVHFRTGFVDWIQKVSQNDLLNPENMTLHTSEKLGVWRRVEDALQQCVKGPDGKERLPCVNWGSFDRGYGSAGREEVVSGTTPTLEYALRSHRCAQVAAVQCRCRFSNPFEMEAILCLCRDFTRLLSLTLVPALIAYLGSTL